MATKGMGDFSGPAVTAYPPEGYGQPQQYGMGPTAQKPGFNSPPNYVTTAQPQYGGQQQYGPAIIMSAAQPVRETGPPPDTTTSFVISILSLFLCLGAWPFAVVAIIFNRKANGQKNLGQYTTARGSLKIAYIFIAVTVILGIIAWAIFAIRLKATLDAIHRYDYNRNRYYG